MLVYDGIEDQTPTVFADLRGDVYDQGDRGLAGLAVDPDFPDRPYVYVLYTYDHILGDPAPRAPLGHGGHRRRSLPRTERRRRLPGERAPACG